jgi:hypothetical protein
VRDRTKPVPSNHVAAIAYARVFGPKQARTPEGHPILISSGVFDNTIETAVSAIRRAAHRWHGIVQSADSDWLLIFEEKVIEHPRTQSVPYSVVYVFRYLPEQQLWEQKGLSDSTVINHFESSWYLTKSTPIDPASGHTVKAPTA